MKILYSFLDYNFYKNDNDKIGDVNDNDISKDMVRTSNYNILNFCKTLKS